MLASFVLKVRVVKPCALLARSARPVLEAALHVMRVITVRKAQHRKPSAQLAATQVLARARAHSVSLAGNAEKEQQHPLSALLDPTRLQGHQIVQLVMQATTVQEGVQRQHPAHPEATRQLAPRFAQPVPPAFIVMEQMAPETMAQSRLWCVQPVATATQVPVNADRVLLATFALNNLLILLFARVVATVKPAHRSVLHAQQDITVQKGLLQ